MALTPQESAFIARRRTLVRRWPVAGGACLALILAIGLWLWFTRPLLINPVAVFAGIEAGEIPDSSLLVMAAMLPVAMLACLVVLVAAVIFMFVAIANERRHLGIIERLSSSGGMSAQ